VSAAGDLEASANRLRDSLAAACADIVTDLGGAVPPASDDPNETTEPVCAAAGDLINEGSAGVQRSIAIAPPSRTIDSQAQRDCEASCDVSGSCEPGSIEARCEPGELSVVCDGGCKVGAYCEASAGATVTCEGRCEGVCEGECSGSTNDAGECEGTCSGQC